MENPFEYSNHVTGKAFCNRREEIAKLTKYIQASQNVLVYSHRRFGKSSLIKKVFQDMKNKKSAVRPMYVDLYGTVSESDFLTRCFKGLSQIESNIDKLVTAAASAMKQIRLSLSIDPNTGNPSVSPIFGTQGKEAYLEEFMAILEQYSAKHKLVIALDEFQEVCDYAENSFEKRLRSFIQGHSHICYIFSGSQQHILTEMFGSGKRAFYKLADSFPVGKIATKHYIPWIQDLFKEKKVSIDKSLAENIVERFDNHPMHIQNFLFHLWGASGDGSDNEELSEDLIARIENNIIQSKELEYENLWDPLTLNQKKTVILVIKNRGKNIFSADALQKVDLKTASLVTKTLQTLMKKELLIKNRAYRIQDIVFEKWLKKKLDIF